MAYLVVAAYPQHITADMYDVSYTIISRSRCIAVALPPSLCDRCTNIWLPPSPRYTRSWMLPWENMPETFVFLWKTLENIVEDLDTSRTVPWKTQNQQLKYMFILTWNNSFCVFQAKTGAVRTSSSVSSSVFHKNTRVLNDFRMALYS